MAFPWGLWWGWWNHMSVGVAAWKLSWAGHTKWLPQRVGTWYWLLNGSSAKGPWFPLMWAPHWTLGLSHKKRTSKPPSDPDGSCKTFTGLGIRSCGTVVVLYSTESWRTVVNDGERNRFYLWGESGRAQKNIWEGRCFSSHLWKIEPASPICFSTS